MPQAKKGEEDWIGSEENRAEGKTASRRPAKEMPRRALTLETYLRFFLDPWNTRITVDQLNQVCM